MTTRRDDWKARLRGWLFDDILRKLIAIVLAVGLWLWLDQQLEDSRTLILALQPVELASPEETAGSHELAVRYDGDRYRVIGFRDAFTDQPEIDVALTLQGPRHLIAQLDENRGFSVVPQQRPGEPPVAEFDIGRIRAQNPRFQPLLRALDPPVVRVLLERKVERDFPFSREAVEIEAPGAEWLFPRLLLDQIDFEPDQVVLVGPKSELDELERRRKIFRVVLTPPPEGRDFVQAAIEPRWSGDVQTRPRTLHLRIPLRVQSTEVVLPEVPVVLDLPPRLEGRFELAEDSRRASVRIEAMGTLDSLLAGKSADERRAWAAEYARLVATVPEDADGPDVITRPHFFIHGFREDTHYRVTLLPTISFEPRKP